MTRNDQDQETLLQNSADDVVFEEVQAEICC